MGEDGNIVKFIIGMADHVIKNIFRGAIQFIVNNYILLYDLIFFGKNGSGFPGPFGGAGDDRIQPDFFIEKPVRHLGSIIFTPLIERTFKIAERGIGPIAFGMTDKEDCLHSLKIKMNS